MLRLLSFLWLILPVIPVIKHLYVEQMGCVCSLTVFLIFPQEHKELATRLHSATTDLKNRVQEMSQAEAQEKIVNQAEEHAENLQKLAKRLQE